MSSKLAQVLDRDLYVLSPYLFAVYVDDIGKIFNARRGTFVVLYADDICC